MSDNPRSQTASLVRDLQNLQHTMQTAQEKLVALQAVLLMILATERSGPSYAEHQAWFLQALGAANFHYYHIRHVRSAGKLLGQDIDAHHLLARRAWLTLVTLERWHSAGTASPTLVPDELTQLCPEDHAIFGDIGYYLLRWSSLRRYTLAGADESRLIICT